MGCGSSSSARVDDSAAPPATTTAPAADKEAAATAAAATAAVASESKAEAETSASASSPLLLYGDLMSAPVRTVVQIARLAGVPHEVREVDLMKGEQRGAEFTAKFPAQRLPALEHDGVFSGESHAILRYMASTFPAKFATLFPSAASEPELNAKVNQLLDWHQERLRMDLDYVTNYGVFYPMLKFPVPDYGLEMQDTRTDRDLAHLEGMLQNSGGAFLTGDKATVADVSIAHQVHQLSLARYVLAHRPAVVAWMAAVKKLGHWDDVAVKIDGFAATLPKEPVLPVRKEPVPAPKISAVPAAVVKDRSKPVKLYVDLVSAPCRQVVQKAIEVGVPHEIVPVDLTKKEHYAPDFLKLNPLAAVPVLTTEEGFVLTESHAIIRYFDDQYGAAQGGAVRTTFLANSKDQSRRVREALPDDSDDSDEEQLSPAKALVVDFWLEWNQGNLRASADFLMVARVFAPLMGWPMPPTYHVDLEAKLHDSLAFMNAHLADRKWLAGRHRSNADLVLFHQLRPTEISGVDMSKYPHILRWSKRFADASRAIDEEMFSKSVCGKFDGFKAYMESQKAAGDAKGKDSDKGKGKA